MLLFGGMCNIWISDLKRGGMLKWGLMRHLGRNTEDTGAEGVLNVGTRLKQFQRRRLLLCGLEIAFAIF